MASARLVLTAAAGGLAIGLVCAAAAVLLASPLLLALAWLRGPADGLSASGTLAAAVGWPAAAFAALQLAQLLAVAATARSARRWVAALTVAAAVGAAAGSPRPARAAALAALTLGAAAVSWRLESGLGPLAPSLKVPPGPGV